MKLPKVGPPNETARVGSAEIRIRDDLGLPLDPMNYAEPDCTTCHGRGVFTLIRPATNSDVKRMVTGNADIEKAVKAGGNVFRSMNVCSCVQPRYERARKMVKESSQKG